MKKFITILITFFLIFSLCIPVNATSLSNNEEIKDTINKENKTGITIALIGTSTIILILTLYKKKKITL